MRSVDPSEVTICSPLWGDYWERWGKPKWLPQMLALDPQPYEFLIIADKPIDGLGNRFRVVVEPEVNQDTWFSFAAKHMKTQLMIGCGLDDGMPVDSLKDLVFGGDITLGPLLGSDGKIYQPTQQGWENIYEEEWFPLTGWALWSLSMLERIKFREVACWSDWIYFLECRAAGIHLTFDTKVRSYYTHHTEQYSRNPAPHSFDDIALMKRLAKKGGIIPGTCWPPEVFE